MTDGEKRSVTFMSSVRGWPASSDHLLSLKPVVSTMMVRVS
jgi:hypothetical protein